MFKMKIRSDFLFKILRSLLMRTSELNFSETSKDAAALLNPPSPVSFRQMDCNRSGRLTRQHKVAPDGNMLVEFFYKTIH